MRHHLSKRFFLFFLLLMSLLLLPAVEPSVHTVQAATKQNRKQNRVTLNHKKLILKPGQKAILRLTGTWKKVRWSFSKKNQIVILYRTRNSCQIAARKAGSVLVTARAGKKKYRCQIRIDNRSWPSCQATDSIDSTEISRSTVSDESGSSSGIINKVVQPHYSYQLKLLNNNTIYTGMNVGIYIKTDNPGNSKAESPGIYESIYVDEGCAKGFWNNAFAYYNDIPYSIPNLVSYISKVPGGYVRLLSFKQKGVYTISAGDNMLDAFGTKYQNIPYGTPSSITITVQDYASSEEPWLAHTLSSQTAGISSEQEKMSAMQHYLTSTMHYHPSAPDGSAYTLLSSEGAVWETHEVDCWNTANLMCRWASLCGLESRKVQSNPNNPYHVCAEIKTDGKWLRYEVPVPDYHLISVPNILS